MSERKSSRRKKIEKPREELSSDNSAPAAVKEPEEKRTVYPTTSISFVWDSLNTKRRINEDFKNEIIDLYYDIQKKPSAQIENLENKLEEYPDIQIFYNYLFTAYHLEEMDNKALEIAEKGAKKFPDYITGKILYIESCIQKNELNKIPDYLDEKYTYKELFPEKGIYHIFEILHFNYAMGKFLALSGEKEGAQKCMEDIKAIDPDCIFIKQLQKVIDKAAGVKFYQKVLRRFKKSS
ncbi:MAG: hypothetical protein KDK36_21120 [Leptospiraceae bacterium]|nr:hypothetical protein [Leptospiraceae bacterium]